MIKLRFSLRNQHNLCWFLLYTAKCFSGEMLSILFKSDFFKDQLFFFATGFFFTSGNSDTLG